MSRLAIDPKDLCVPDYAAIKGRLYGPTKSFSDRLNDMKAAILERAAENQAQREAEIRERMRLAEKREERLKSIANAAEGIVEERERNIALIESIAAKHDVATNEIFGVSRIPERIKSARQEAYYEMRMRNPDWGLIKVAVFFGRDHSTILWGIARHCKVNDIPYDGPRSAMRNKTRGIKRRYVDKVALRTGFAAGLSDQAMADEMGVTWEAVAKARHRMRLMRDV